MTPRRAVSTRRRASIGATVLLADAMLLTAAVQPGAPPFREVAEEVGLRFVHDNGGRGEYYLPEIMGSGGALFDYDNDGDLDVYLVQGAPFGAEPAPGGRSGSGPARTADGRKSAGPAARTSRLFRNELIAAGDSDGARGGANATASGAAGRGGAAAGRLRFTDVTERAGVGLHAPGMGTAVADYDNDGDLDLLVTAFGRNALYRNNGDGTFADVTEAAGVGDTRWSTSAAFVDYDRDGDLDLFVAAYVDFTVGANKVCTDPVGARDYCSPKAYKPVPSRLFRNEGDGRFADVSDAAGITRAYGNGLGVSVGDYDADGWLDLFVANDATPNQLWLNRQNGTFEDQGLLSGTAFNAAGNPEGSMGIASGDYDNDGDEDLFVTNLIGESHALYVNDGRGSFEDSRSRAALGPPTAPYTGFGTYWFDYDRDGRLDLFIANGAVNIVESLRGQPFPFHQRDQLFRQSTDGRFVDETAQAGPALRLSEVGRGAAFGDIDNDGDVDVLVTNNNGAARLLLNESGAGRHWLTVRLDQSTTTVDRSTTMTAATGKDAACCAAGGRWAFGARVGVERRGEPTLWRRVGTDGSYLSANDARIHVGLGSSTRVDAVVIEWADGRREHWTDITIDRAITLRRGTGAAADAVRADR